MAPLEALPTVLEPVRAGSLPNGIRQLVLVPLHNNRIVDGTTFSCEQGVLETETGWFLAAMRELKELESLVLRSGVELALDKVRDECLRRGIAYRLTE